MLEYSYSSDPTPYMYLPRLLPPEIYQKIDFFPDIKVQSKGRSGQDLFMGEPGYDEIINRDGYKELYVLFTSPEFVIWVLSIFDEDLGRHRCPFRAKDAKLISPPFLETREMLAEAPEILDTNAPVHEVNRFDFAVGDLDYTPYVHLDSVRRVIGGMLFFSDAEEEKIVGGEFTLYQDLLFAIDRVPHWPYPVKKFPLKKNTGVLFLNSNTGFHGPSKIESIHGLRKWVYYSISSRNGVWKTEKASIYIRVANRILGRTGLAKQSTKQAGSKHQARLIWPAAFLPEGWGLPLGLIVIFAAANIKLFAAREMVRVKPNLNIRKPANDIATSGLYGVSRNPLYIGIICSISASAASSIPCRFFSSLPGLPQHCKRV